jgi:hypothetical protein
MEILAVNPRNIVLCHDLEYQNIQLFRREDLKSLRPVGTYYICLLHVMYHVESMNMLLLQKMY